MGGSVEDLCDLDRNSNNATIVAKSLSSLGERFSSFVICLLDSTACCLLTSSIVCPFVLALSLLPSLSNNRALGFEICVRVRDECGTLSV